MDFVVELVQLKAIISDSADLASRFFSNRSVSLNKASQVSRRCRILTTKTDDEHLVETGIQLQTCWQSVLYRQFKMNGPGAYKRGRFYNGPKCCQAAHSWRKLLLKSWGFQQTFWLPLSWSYTCRWVLRVENVLQTCTFHLSVAVNMIRPYFVETMGNSFNQQ